MNNFPYDVDSLRRRVRGGERFTYVPFYGHTDKSGARACFSQHYKCDFTDDDGVSYNCTEQYMMACKALEFSDLTNYDKIMKVSNPSEIKKLGRLVSPFDDDHWKKVRFDIVVHGNIFKFRQNKNAREILFKTGDSILVEASPRDTIWGIGYGVNSPNVHDPFNWRGSNLLGFALTKVKHILREEFKS